jgi:hypothetical protein
MRGETSGGKTGDVLMIYTHGFFAKLDEVAALISPTRAEDVFSRPTLELIRN